MFVQLLEQSRQQTEQLADVKEWQSRISAYLHMGELEEGLTERKQVRQEEQHSSIKPVFKANDKLHNRNIFTQFGRAFDGE